MLCSPGWPRTYSVAQANLRLRTVLMFELAPVPRSYFLFSLFSQILSII